MKKEINNIHDNAILSDKDNHEGWTSYLATVGLSTIGGAIIGGLPGGMIGLSASIIDKYLINNNLADKHYLSIATFWSTTTLTPAASFVAKILPSYSLPIYAISYALSFVAPYLSDDFLNFRNKIETPLNSFLTINKFFDEKEIISRKEVEKIYNKFFESPYEALGIIVHDIQEIYNNKFLSTFALSNSLSLLNIVIDNLFLNFLASYGSNLFISTLINNQQAVLTNFQNPASISLSSLTPLKPFLIEGVQIIGLYAVKSGVEFFIGSQQNALYKDQFDMVLQQSTKIILDNGNGRKILATDQGKEIIQNITSDLFILLFSGVNRLNNIMAESSQSLISLNNLIKYSPEAFSPYAFSLIPMQIFLEKTAQDTKEIAEKLAETQTKLWDVKSDITDNIEQINLRDGEEFVKFKYNSLLSEQNSLTKKSEYLSKVQVSATTIIELLNQVIDIAYFGAKFITNQINVKHIPLIKISVDNLYKFLSSNLYFQIENNDLIISQERIDKLFEMIATTNDNNIKRTINNKNKIIFDNYTLALDGKELVKIDHFEFDAGKRYAITGKSGCGKTSTLIDLKEGVSGALSSIGEISISEHESKKPKIMFIDQKVYLSKELTLLESIYFPSILQLLSKEQVNELKIKIVELFKELEIDEFINSSELTNKKGLVSRLDSTKFKLSDGQTKKIAIIQAILNNPDILIMDETFTGLDKNSLIKVEQSINKYLPNALILSVDHHAEDNNYNGFYDSEVHFSNGTVTEKQIISKYIETSVSEQEDTDHSLLNDMCLNISIFDDWNTNFT